MLSVSLGALLAIGSVAFAPAKANAVVPEVRKPS